MTKSKSGFTIVELLIVIVVIGILAAITIVAYNGIQQRARDASMRTAATEFEKAFIIWSIDYNVALRGGSGSTVAASNGQCADGANGFAGSRAYACSVEDALVSARKLPSGFSAKLPKNTYFPATPAADGEFTFMMYDCGANKYSLYWTLENPTATESANLSSTLTTCGDAANLETTYGMRAAKIISVN